MCIYLESDVRSNLYKATSNVISADSGGEAKGESCDLLETLKELKSSQSLIADCLNNVTQLVLNSKTENNGDISQVGSTGKRCVYHDTDSHQTADCNGFSRMDASDKLKLLRQKGVCFKCLTVARHTTRICKSKTRCGSLANGVRCTADHHPSLHEMFGNLWPTSSPGAVSNLASRESLLLMVGNVY